MFNHIILAGLWGLFVPGWAYEFTDDRRMWATVVPAWIIGAAPFFVMQGLGISETYGGAWSVVLYAGAFLWLRKTRSA